MAMPFNDGTGNRVATGSSGSITQRQTIHLTTLEEEHNQPGRGTTSASVGAPYEAFQARHPPSRGGYAV